MARTLVMGDLHGCHKGLVQCLERSNFDMARDRLIQLGDIADGWPYVYECVEELIMIENLVSIRGNHDDWFIQWITKGIHPDNWRQGGFATAQSYARHIQDVLVEHNNYSGWYVGMRPNEIPASHKEFWLSMDDYHLEEGKLFIHGGFNRHIPLQEQPRHVYWWDRDLWSAALSLGTMDADALKPGSHLALKFKEPFKEIYIGHTTTNFWKKDVPMKADIIWNLDTGAGWNGKLTIMDIDTKEFWQSDPAPELYPKELGRRNAP